MSLMSPAAACRYPRALLPPLPASVVPILMLSPKLKVLLPSSAERWVLLMHMLLALSSSCSSGSLTTIPPAPSSAPALEMLTMLFP